MKSIFLLGAIATLAGLTVAHPVEKREQKGVPTTPTLDLRPLHWGDVNFLHTTDTHGWLEGHIKEENYNADFGDFYSFVSNMRKEARIRRKDLFVIDSGDTHDGNGLSDVTPLDGTVTQPILTDLKYDVLTIGNHELYVDAVAQDVYKNFAPKWKGRYLTSNVFIKDVATNKTVPISDQFTYFTGNFGTKVLAFGFLYDFTGNGPATIVQKVEATVNQTWFKQALADYDVDIFVIAGHIPIRWAEFQAVYNAIRALHPAKPIAFFGGHTHIRDFHVYDGRAAAIESGRFMETIGWLSVDGLRRERGLPESATIGKNLTWTRRYLDTNRQTYQFHTKITNRGHGQNFDTAKGKQITELIATQRNSLNLSYLYGCAPHDYYLSRVNIDSEYSIFSLVANEILPQAVHNTSRPYPSHIIINTGSQRFDLYKGPFTLDDTYIVSPFKDTFRYIAGVPYSVVSQILPKLNSAGGPQKKRAVSIDGVVASVSSSEHFRNYAYHNHTVPIVPGYTTSDDYGADGDDTVHSAIPFVTVVDYISSPFPANPQPDDLYDLVYLDFFESTVVSFVKALTTNTTVSTAIYRNDGVDINKMYPEFVEKAWSRSC